MSAAVVHAKAILDDSSPVCRVEVADGDRLGADGEANCPLCLNVFAGAAVKSIKWTTR